MKQIDTMEKAEKWGQFSNTVIWSAVILIYSLLLAVYFSLIIRKFIAKECHFQIQEYAFLILPNAAALCISITLKMLIVSVEN